jgi:hypothetical protein
MLFTNLPALILSDALASAVTPWMEHQERRILREGRGLTASELAMAGDLGISRPQNVRVLLIDPIPVPVPQAWISLANGWGLPVFAPGGMTLGYGIFAAAESMDLVRHELVHVAQYERLGGIAPFLKRYLFECLTVGYADAPLELEARRRGG